MTEFERLRTGMVDGQIRVADVTDRRVLAAFLAVERERFVPADRRDIAYLDVRTPLGGGRAMVEPMILAKLVQLADPKEGERVLVVGAGLGYSAAIFARLAGSVVALEEAPFADAARQALAGVDRVSVVEGGLAAGAPGEGPYDIIFFDGAVFEGLDAFASQLAPNGRIVAPAGRARPTKATVFRVTGAELTGVAAFDAAAPTLPGFEPVEAFAL
ncbi:protein-L-isoaspartate O-methyltransferase [Methylopila musalis]|uniref:Protein-L-isoaspartate O-methyltransferase n=1 Tax=Methylopila musalis TaxID=1134781 RepID=A0ABW3Z7A1_9HYPH